MAVEIGAAYLSLLPDLSRLGPAIRTEATSAIDEVAREMETRLGEAADRAGANIGQGVERGTDRAGSSIAELGVSIAAVATIAGGIGQAMEKSLQGARLEAALGISPADAKVAAETAGKVYAAAWGDSLGEVTDSVGEVMKGLQGLNLGAGANIETLTTKALAFKGAFGTEVPESIRAVGQMVKTGMVPDVQAGFDVLAIGFQNGANKADDLVDTFNEYGVQFQKLGLDGPKALGLISQAIQAGARDSDVAADALKEFSIRAVDGSKTSATAFEALGLNAEKMTKQIAAGGPAAEAGLSTVLTKLKAIKDPATQAQIAVGLFGTQSEDLGKALYAMDPATATAANGLDRIKGAGDQVTAAMNKATPPLEVFKRQGLEAVSSAASGALPLLNGLMAVVGPIAPELGAAGLALGGFVIAMKGVEMVQGAIATIKGFELATKATTIATYASSVATGIATAAQWLWNAAFIASPIGWIVLAIGALVGVVIYCWTHFEGFRKVVIACWDGIKTATMWVWENALKPAFDGIVIGVKAVGSFFSWLWTNAIQPAWNGISAAISFAWNSIILPVFGAIQWYVNLVGSVFMWLYHNIIEPVWTGIKLAISIAWALIQVIFGVIQIEIKILAAVFTWLWRNIIEPAWQGIKLAVSIAWAAIQIVFGLIEIGVKIVGAIFTWLWNNAIVPAWNGIKAAAQLAWNFLDTMVFKPIAAGVNAVGAVFTWLWNNAIVPAWNGIKAAVSAAWSWIRDTVFSPIVSFVQNTLGPPFNTLKAVITAAWDGIKAGISAAWNWVRDNVFNPIKTAITVDVPRAFDAGKQAIANAWNGIRDAAKVPIRFVVETVINQGIIDNYNKLADMFHVGKVSHVNLPAGFATGGLISGPGTGTSDSILAQVVGGPNIRVSNGEYIVPAKKVRQFGVGFFDWIAGKRGPTTKRPGDGSEGLAFAGGGLIDFGKDLWSAISDPAKLLTGPINALIGRIPGGGMARDVVVGMAHKTLDGLIGWVKGLVGTGPVAAAQAFAKAQAGKPYGWANAGPGSYDCSGIMSAVWNVMHGKNPYSHTFSTASEAKFFPLSGHGLFTAGWAGAGEKGGGSVGHTAGNLAGLGIESTGSGGVRIGSGTTSVDSFAHVGHYDRGGVIPEGVTAVINQSRRPEALLAHGQWRDMKAVAEWAAAQLAAGKRAGGDINIYPQRADFTVQDLEALQGRQEALARAGRSR